jgi:hypothetical protein
MTRNSGGLMFVLISLISWPKETVFLDTVIMGDGIMVLSVRFGKEMPKHAMESSVSPRPKKARMS